MDSPSGKKRKSESGHENNRSKQAKGKKKWAVPQKSRSEGREEQSRSPHEPQVGDAGIWVTCDLNKEARSVTELRPLFEEHAARIYDLAKDDYSAVPAGDVEDEIAQELAGIRNAELKLFRSYKIDTPCLLFFKTMPPVNPSEFVTSFCRDAAARSDRKQTRSVKRLTPVTLVSKATEKGIDELAASVLPPHFQEGDKSERKFAIRINLRNHNVLKRDDIIRQVAAAVGPGHKVDLKNYDLLIMVEIYRSTCGMTVVGKEFESLKRFNLSEIYSSKSSLSNTEE